ncbi:MAG: hypothetical protein ACFFD5_02225 [Candidatus Thorarchaeota archaeon]
MRRLYTNRKNLNKFLIISLLILSFFTPCIIFFNFIQKEHFRSGINQQLEEIPKTSKLIGVINLTNYEINLTSHYHNSIIPIRGKIYKPVPPPPPYDNLTNINVTLVVDGIEDRNFIATSDQFGEFQIDYQIPFSLDVYSSHKIEVKTTDDLGNDDILPENFFIIFVNATSYLDINYIDSPYIPGELFNLNGFLKLDDINGDGIPNAQLDYYWYNATDNWPLNNFFTNPVDGSISENIQIPFDAYSDIINLNLSYIGDPINGIDESSIEITQIKLFNDMNCNWNILSNATEGDQLNIAGQLTSRKSASLKLYNRSIRIFYDNNLINSVDTDTNGNFQYTYTIPPGPGNNSIRIELITTGGPYIFNSTNITIVAATTQLPSGPETPVPFLGFALIFFPILIGIIVGLAGYGFYYYKKQNKESKVINLPLESKIINLKILKETGRLEESLSYLFNAIYMDLISAKYGRIRKINETIRDFAIVSVKQLNLKPSNVYPFIQKVEEIIYAKPYQITEKEFYSAIELFSPVYYELTGYHFILNF